MRTTLDLDDDVLAAIKEIASRRGSTAGQTASALIRQALQPTDRARTRNGIPVLPKRPAGAPIPTMNLVNQLRDDA